VVRAMPESLLIASARTGHEVHVEAHPKPL
jgi:hypothetical protein